MTPTGQGRSADLPPDRLKRRRRTWTVANAHDPNDSFEVQAVSYRGALAAALTELGWTFLFESDAAAEAAYLASDQPMTCPKCGARTAYESLDETSQRHACPACAHAFLVEFEDEEEGDDDEA